MARPVVLEINRKLSGMSIRTGGRSATQPTTDPNSTFGLDDVSGSVNRYRTSSTRELLEADDHDEGLKVGPSYNPYASYIASTAKHPTNSEPAKLLPV